MLSRMETNIVTVTFERQWNPLTILAHPTDPFGGYANHQCVGQDIFVHDSTGADKGYLPIVTPQRMVQLAPSVTPLLSCVWCGRTRKPLRSGCVLDRLAGCQGWFSFPSYPHNP